MRPTHRVLVLASAFLCLTLQSCSLIEPESQMPLLVWYADLLPGRGFEGLNEVRAAGFTIAHVEEGDQQQNRLKLALADSLDLQLLVTDRRLLRAGLDELPLETAVFEAVQDYRPFSSLWGYLVAINPQRRDFPRLGRIQEQLAQADPDHPAMFLIPDTDAVALDFAVASYSAYLTLFMEIVRPAVLTCALLSDSEYRMRADGYTHLDLLHRVSARYKVPFWGVVQCLAPELQPPPQHSHLRVQIYSALAYGARGVHYYAYQAPPKLSFRAASAFQQNNGMPNRLYDEVKTINSELQHLAPVLNQLQVEAVFHTDPLPNGCLPLPTDALIYRIDGKNILISYLRSKHGDRYALLLNKDTDRGAKIRVYFAHSVKKVIEIGKNGLFTQETIWNLAQNRNERMTFLLFKAGDGILLKIE